MLQPGGVSTQCHFEKYNIAEDDQRVSFIHEAAELISTLPSAVQREIYGHRVAEKGKISDDAMKMEIGKAYKRRVAREKKKQEQIDLAPERARQPRIRNVHYDNIRSAMAEEGVLAMVLRDPSLLDRCGDLTVAEFSVPLLGKVYQQMMTRHMTGLEVSFGALEDLSPEEMSHLASIVQRQEGPVSEAAFQDCVATIHAEAQGKRVSTDDDLMAYRNKLKERKGTM